jgi:hypothetical protein
MRRLPLVLVLLVPSLANAASWADFAAAFPAFPCSDGWMACRVDGQAVTPDLHADASGHLVPADLRVGWDLQPTLAFSPFATLSAYPETVAVAEPVAPPEPPAHPVHDVEVAQLDRRVPDPIDKPVPPPPRFVEPLVPANPPKDLPADPGKDVAKVAPPIVPENPADATKVSLVRPKDPAVPVIPDNPVAEVHDPAHDPAHPSDPASTGRETAPPPLRDPHAVDPAKDPAKDVAKNPVTAPPPADPAKVAVETPKTDAELCGDLHALEPKSMLGTLGPQVLACLERSYAAAAKPTDKDKISRVLMNDANGRGDKAEWARLIQRHLTEIDASDPDLSLKYARVLAGQGRSNDAIKYAELALDRKSAWTNPNSFVTNVSAAYKIRATAANDLWQKAATAYAAAPDDALKAKSDAAQNRTKVFAREWYEYAKSADKDATLALQLCVSAAGTADYCQVQ